MPALLEGLKLSNKAAHVGFDWPNTKVSSVGSRAKSHP